MASTNVQVQNIVDFIRKTWPDIVLSESRIQGWIDEINNGTGRSILELRADIFKYVVGDDRVKQYVRDAFESRNINIATGDEDEETRIARIAGELASGERTFVELGETLDAMSPDTNPDDGVEITDEGPDESVSEEGVGGGTDDTVSILTSEDMRWYFDPTSGKWYVSYKLPNSERHVFFEATGSELDAIFGEGNRPANYETTTLADITQKEGFTFAGNISEVEGTGTFESEVERVIALALDEGILPDWASDDPAVMDILFIAQSEGKSQDWVIEQLSKLPSFKARFPGIENLTNLGLTIAEAVDGFLQFEKGLKDLALRAGDDPDSISPQDVADLMAKGHSLEDATFVYQIFDTMEKNAGALEAFNEVLVAHGMEPLDADGMYEFMAGNAPAEMYDLWENTSLHRAAQDAGLNLDVDAAIALAKRTEGLTSYSTALEGLSEAARNILKFRSEIALDRYNIDPEDLIDLSMGLPPSSGVSQADLARNMERAIQSAAAQRNRARVNPFKNFTEEGTPKQASLANTRTEG